MSAVDAIPAAIYRSAQGPGRKVPHGVHFECFGHLPRSAPKALLFESFLALFGLKKRQNALKMHSLGHSEAGAQKHSKCTLWGTFRSGPLSTPVNGAQDRNAVGCLDSRVCLSWCPVQWAFAELPRCAISTSVASGECSSGQEGEQQHAIESLRDGASLCREPRWHESREVRIREEKQHKHKLFGPDFPRTFLTLTPGWPGVKKFLPATGAAGKRTFWCRRPRSSARTSMTRRVVRKTLYKKGLR